MSVSSNPSSSLINQISQIVSERLVQKPQVLPKPIAGDSYVAVGAGTRQDEDLPLADEAILQTIRKKYKSRALRLLHLLRQHPVKVTFSGFLKFMYLHFHIFFFRSLFNYVQQCAISLSHILVFVNCVHFRFHIFFGFCKCVHFRFHIFFGRCKLCAFSFSHFLFL